jgi:protein-S-isoprenylcysteine O-methyltransferase Ste14
MNPWYGKAAVLVASAVLIAIRAPHGERSRSVPVARTRRGVLEAVLLTFAWVTFVLPLLWVATPWFSFADYPLRPVPFAAGLLLLSVGLWLFHRSHADLGTNWSITLEVRAGHRLVTGGVYRRVRHPMYTAILLHSAGFALVLPNLLAGPSYPLAIVLIVACRLGPEERMMVEEFGGEYEAYRARTKRLLPGIW